MKNAELDGCGRSSVNRWPDLRISVRGSVRTLSRI